MLIPPLASMPVEYLTPLIEDRAVEVLLAPLSVVNTKLRRFPTF